MLDNKNYNYNISIFKNKLFIYKQFRFENFNINVII